MPADRCACRKVPLKGDVDVLVKGDRSHARELCCPDLTTAFVEAAEDIIAEAREVGSLTTADKKLLVALVRAEGGGRCVVCGCTQDDACEGGCGWTSDEMICCDAHTAAEIADVHKLFKDDQVKLRRAS